MQLLPSLSLLLLAGTAISVQAAAVSVQDTLKPRNWDLRLLTFPSSNITCDPDSGNFDLSIYHRSGLHAYECTSLVEDKVNTSAVDTISWKSPTTRYDLCMYGRGDCSGESYLGVVRSGWEICGQYSAWTGWRVVEANASCI